MTGPSDHDWGRATPRARRAWLKRFRHAVAAEMDTLIDLVCEDVGKTSFEALTADVLPLLAACRWHEKNAGRILRPRRLALGPVWHWGQRHRVLRAPLGHVAIIGTWNYPLQLLGVQVVQALAAGNRVTVKPSERSPRSQIALLKLANGAGLPPGALGWVGATREEGERLLREGIFDKVVFTGSTAVGREIARRCAETLTPSALELSGRDTAFVRADADVGMAARTILAGVRMNAGQTCMSPKRAIVERPVYDEFVRTMRDLLKHEPARRLSSEEEAAWARSVAARARAGGANDLSDASEPPDSALRPLVFSDVAPDMDLFEGACFAPTLAITPAEDWEHALALQARIEQRLATSIFTRATVGARNIGEVDIFSLGSGSVVVNDVITPVAHPAAPIGGRGESGWGVTQGVEGLLAMTRAVHVARTGRFMRTTEIAADARTERRLKALARLLYGGRGRGRGVRGGIRGAGEDEGSGPGEAGEGPRPASRRGDKVEAHG